MKDKQAVQIDTRQEIHLILNTREGHFEKLDRLDSLFKQKLKEQEVLLEACKAENLKLREVGSNVFLSGLLKRILKGQHEVINGALREEVISKSHIKKVFEDLAIKEEKIDF